MAHYAFLDEQNVVIEIIVGRDEMDLAENVTDWESYYGKIRGLVCKRTSYNTQYVYENEYDKNDPTKIIKTIIIGSVHTNGGQPFRGKYAAIGDIYDQINDVFITPAKDFTNE